MKISGHSRENEPTCKTKKEYDSSLHDVHEFLVPECRYKFIYFYDLTERRLMEVCFLMNHFCFINKAQFDLNLNLIVSQSQMSLIGAFILKSYPMNACMHVYLELDGWRQLHRSCSVSTFSCVDESSEGSAHHRPQLSDFYFCYRFFF